MSRNKYFVKINRDALQDELHKRGLTMSGISLEMGYSDGYIKTASASGELKESVVKMLEQLYSIKRETIEEREPDHETVAPDMAFTIATPEQLKNIIVEAIKEAMA